MDSFFLNKVLMITISVWIVTQTMKVFLGVIREKRFNFKWLIGTGGMPSSHAAGATALATTCGLETGFNSVIFAFATVFALVTMFDAQGVRRSAGQQAAILNRIMDDMYRNQKIETDRLFELIGHSPLQVMVGALFGGVFSYFLYLNWA